MSREIYYFALQIIRNTLMFHTFRSESFENSSFTYAIEAYSSYMLHMFNLRHKAVYKYSYMLHE